MTARPNICVKEIRTGKVKCNTKVEGIAAERLRPGTTYGTGWSKEQADSQAETRRQFHLAQGY
jgi:hypothetical protein